MSKIKNLKSVVAKNIWKSLPNTAKTKIVQEIAKHHVRALPKSLSQGISKQKSYLSNIHKKGVREIARAKQVSDVDALRALHKKTYGTSPKVMEKLVENAGKSPAEQALDLARQKAKLNLVKRISPKDNIDKLMKMDPYHRMQYINAYEDIIRTTPTSVLREIAR